MALPSRARNLLAGLPAVRGVAAGVSSFGLGYAVAYLAKSGDVATRIGTFLFLGDLPSVWQGVGWVFFAMHGVALEGAGSLSGAPVSRSVTANQLRDAWLLLVPVVLLLAAGYLVAGTVTPERVTEGVLAGATLVFGYFPVSLGLLFASRWEARGTAFGRSFDVTVGPDPVLAVVLAGLVYPLLFGAAGGAVAAWRRDSGR